MEHESNIRHGRKHHRRVFDDAAIDVLRDIFQSVCRDFEATLIKTDGEDEHVHLLIEQPKTPDWTAPAASSRLAVALSISGMNAGASAHPGK